MGVTYTALQNTFGIMLEVVPNLVAMTGRNTSYASVSPSSLTGSSGK
jgi:hypothetical protein